MTPLDLYCERCTPVFWAEPVNALTNAAFLVAAFFCRQLAVQHERLTLEISFAIALAVTVGVGSFVFHTVATHWAMWFDIVPILLLQCGCVWLYCRRIMSLPVPACMGILVLLVGGGAAGGQFRTILNGSLGYLPALLILGGMGVWQFRHQAAEPRILLYATLVFLIALVFRTIDLVVCDAFPLGTHFLWHLFNGGTVYLVLRCLILNLPHTGVPQSRSQP